MDDSKHVQLVWEHPVDDPVGAFDDFADVSLFVLWHCASRLWEASDLLRAGGKAIHHSPRVHLRITRDVIV
jgi:hypothetical protein